MARHQSREIGPDVDIAQVLADAFETRFHPFTADHPRVSWNRGRLLIEIHADSLRQCLLPLVNTPLIEYSLDFLASVGVHGVIIYAGAHADQLETYIK